MKKEQRQLLDLHLPPPDLDEMKREIMKMRSQVKAESQAEMDAAESEDTDREDRDDEDFEAPITKDPENNGILEWREQMAPTVLFEPETGLPQRRPQHSRGSHTCTVMQNL